MNFTVNERGSADGFCLIKSVEKRTSSKGGAYLDITFCDKTGEINGKLWDYNEELHGSFSAGELVKVRGIISQYNGADQIKVERIRKAVESDNLDPSDFVKEAEYGGKQMYDELVRIANSFTDQDIKKLTLHIYEEHKDELLVWPAAYKMHHAIRGGLMMHTLSIVRMCEAACNVYPSVNHDLLIAGAMLHDVGKVYEFDLNSVGTVNAYTSEGNLIGHLVKGAMLIDKAADELGTDPKIKMLLEHMLISHHGVPEFGAAVRPLFIEAELLSTFDNVDAFVYEMEEAVEETAPGDFSKKVWGLDDRKFYNHGLNGVSTDVKLF